MDVFVRIATLDNFGVEKRLVDFVWRRRPGSGRIVRDPTKTAELPLTHMDPVHRNRIVRKK